MFYLFIQTFKLLASYLEYTCYFSINRNNSLFLFPFFHDFSNYPAFFFFNTNLTYLLNNVPTTRHTSIQDVLEDVLQRIFVY